MIADLASIENAAWRRVDAVDFIYQTWACDQHNVGTTLGMNGDYRLALMSIKAKTLVLAGTGDLVAHESDPMEAVRFIPDVRYVPINPTRPMGHDSASGASARENALQNREIGAFLDLVVEKGARPR